jgi:hypothetical protein
VRTADEIEREVAKMSGDVDFIVGLLGYGFDFLLLVLGIVFIAVLVRRFNILVFHTQRVSTTAQQLLAEIKKTSKDVEEIKGFLAPHYIQPEQGESPEGESPTHER